MEGDVEGIRQGVAQLVEQEKRNSNKIQESHAKVKNSQTLHSPSLSAFP